MDFSFSEQQEMLRKIAKDFLTAECPTTLVRDMEDDSVGYPRELWHKIADLGWCGLMIPEEYGGEGCTFLDLMILLEEMGRVCFPGPFFSTVVLGCIPIIDWGSLEQRKEFLPSIAQGSLIMTTALYEPEADYSLSNTRTKVTKAGQQYILNGTKLFVPYAHISDWILCAAIMDESTPLSNESLNLFLISNVNTGVNHDVLVTIAHDKLCQVALHDMKLNEKNILWCGRDGIEKLLQKATIAKSIEMVGEALQTKEMSIEYAKNRMQFGRAIGSFQAVQHHCANMAVDVEAARLMAYRAAWLISEGVSCTKEISMTKVWVNEACQRVMAIGHQIHGAIGFTWDHDMQLFSRRSVAGRVSFGDSNFHRMRLGLSL